MLIISNGMADTKNVHLENLQNTYYVRALCPNSEKMREKRIERERKRYGQN